MQNGDIIRHPKKTAFLEAYRMVGVVGTAARAAGIHRDTHYKWLAADADYEKEFKAAREDAIDVLEEVAIRRATKAEAPSDVLLIFLLKAMRPAIYRERYEVTGRDGQPIQTEHQVSYTVRFEPPPEHDHELPPRMLNRH